MNMQMRLWFVFLGVVGLLAYFWIKPTRELREDLLQSRTLYMGYMPNYTVHGPNDEEIHGRMEKLAYPKSGQFASSTDFFRQLFSSQGKYIYYRLYAIGGVPSYGGTNAHEFTPENNAFSVVLDLQPTRRSLPFGPVIFTRNLHITNLLDADAKHLLDIAPYGEKGVLVVMSDATAKFISAENIATEFNPLGLTNAILQP